MVQVNKYNWKTTPILDEHSKIKHKIYSQYIAAYIDTWMSNYLIPKMEFSIIDGFCGGGIYQDRMTSNDCYGSPIVVLDAVQEGRILANIKREKEREIKAHYFFVDKDKDAIESLKATFNILSNDKGHFKADLPNIHVYQDDFENKLDFLIDAVNHKTKSGGKAIFLLDQYGYGKATINSLSKILNQISKAEIILTFNIDSIYRYFSEKDEFKISLVNLGIADYINWSLYLDLKKTNNRQIIKRFIQREISKAIKSATKAKYMTLFFVKPISLKESGYWLIHLSNSYKAHDVMKTIHWDNATYFDHELEHGIFEFGYETNRDENLLFNALPFEFDDKSEKSCIDAIYHDFAKLIYTEGDSRVQSLFENTVTNTPASERILQQSVKLLHEQGEIEVFNKNGKPRKPSKLYKADDIISSPRQIKFIF